jgi:hypothetical protein
MGWAAACWAICLLPSCDWEWDRGEEVKSYNNKKLLVEMVKKQK